MATASMIRHPPGNGIFRAETKRHIPASRRQGQDQRLDCNGQSPPIRHYWPVSWKLLERWDCVVADAVRIEPVSASKFPDMRESAGYFCSDQCRTRPAFSLPSQAILLLFLPPGGRLRELDQAGHRCPNPHDPKDAPHSYVSAWERLSLTLSNVSRQVGARKTRHKSIFAEPLPTEIRQNSGEIKDAHNQAPYCFGHST